MSMGAIPSGVSSGPLTASGLVKTGEGVLLGILVSSSTSGTIKAWDNTAASGTVLFDTTAAVTAPLYIPVNMAFASGLYLTLGGTISCAAVYV